VNLEFQSLRICNCFGALLLKSRFFTLAGRFELASTGFEFKDCEATEVLQLPAEFIGLRLQISRLSLESAGVLRAPNHGIAASDIW